MNPGQRLLTLTLRAYQVVVSPALHLVCGPLGGCRFSPTCSTYALEAVRRHGGIRGSWLALRRICRCHPWGGSGHDPVPPASSASKPHPHPALPFAEAKSLGCAPSCSPLHK